MRILYLHQYFVPREGQGITRTYEFALRLRQMGHDVTVVTSPGYLPEKYKSLTKVTHVEMEGVPVTIVPVPYAQEMRFSRRLRAFFQFALWAAWVCMNTPADVIYASSGPLTIFFPAVAAKFWQRIPMVFEVRDLWPELPIEMGILRNPFVKAGALALEWLAYHLSAHVVALSPGMAEGVVSRGIAPERVTVVPNCADNELFDVPEETGAPIREKLKLAPEHHLVVYSGAFGMANNVSWLVDIAAEMARLTEGIHFLLVGWGADRDKVIERARALGVLDRTLSVWKPVPKKEMPAVLAASTLSASVLMPIRAMWSSSPNKIFDSLAAGRPVAINYGGWLADLFEKTGAGIRIPDNDPHAAALALAAFLLDPERIGHARRAARELARTEFDRDAMARRLEGVLRCVVERVV